MDRRQRKTREAIFTAFSTLLERKRYDHITVQEILDEADVGRSTFYAHFETKDTLLKAMCGDIFDNIFHGDLCAYAEHSDTLEGKLAHILWHLQDSRSNLLGVLTSDSGELFMNYFREQLRVVFTMHLQDFRLDVPEDFLLNHLVGSFSDTVTWWLKHEMQPLPEVTARYYMKTLAH